MTTIRESEKFNPMTHLILFDIDGTLLTARGAGSRALERTIQQYYRNKTLKVQLPLDGKTDLMIIREALVLAGADGSLEEGLSEEFLAIYGHHLTEELHRCDHFHVLPGVTSLLNRLDQSDDFLSGLATGNVARGARRKLSQANLLSFFHFGGFGCDSESRTEIVRAGILRGQRILGNRFSGKSVVVGDTPRDILHAREAGVKAVGVATGSFDLEQLKQCSPDALFPSLESTEDVLEVLERI